MPMRTELALPLAAQDTPLTDRDLAAIGIFCALGLALSFVFIAYTDTFEQIANLIGACLCVWG